VKFKSLIVVLQVQGFRKVITACIAVLFKAAFLGTGADQKGDRGDRDRGNNPFQHEEPPDRMWNDDAIFIRSLNRYRYI
jgi:hypothetical protein